MINLTLTSDNRLVDTSENIHTNNKLNNKSVEVTNTIDNCCYKIAKLISKSLQLIIKEYDYSDEDGEKPRFHVEDYLYENLGEKINSLYNEFSTDNNILYDLLNLDYDDWDSKTAYEVLHAIYLSGLLYIIDEAISKVDTNRWSYQQVEYDSNISSKECSVSLYYEGNSYYMNIFLDAITHNEISVSSQVMDIDSCEEEDVSLNIKLLDIFNALHTNKKFEETYVKQLDSLYKKAIEFVQKCTELDKNS